METFPERLSLRGSVVVLAATIGTVLAGCGTEPSPAPPPAPPRPAAPVSAPPSPEAVDWTDSVCGALVPVVETLADPPEFDITLPAFVRDAYAAYLAQAQSAADRALADVTAAGAAPVEGGEGIAEEVRGDVLELRDNLADARSQLKQVGGGDASAVSDSVTTASNMAEAIANRAQALTAIDGNPRLDAALAQAESCERLRELEPSGQPVTRSNS